MCKFCLTIGTLQMAPTVESSVIGFTMRCARKNVWMACTVSIAGMTSR